MTQAFERSEVERFAIAIVAKTDEFRRYNEFKESSYNSPENCPTSEDVDGILIDALVLAIRQIRCQSTSREINNERINV